MPASKQRAPRKKATPAPKKAKKPTTELGEVLAATEKRYGGTQIIRASKTVQPMRISTGIFILDLALLGGMPHNRQSMVVGKKHSGKSMLSTLIAASAQYYYPDQQVILVDLEGTFDKVWAQALGVDLERMLIVEPDTGEMAVDISESLIQSKEASLVIIDSLAALVPYKEMEAEAGDQLVGLQARLIGRMVRKLTTALLRERKRQHYVTTLYLNQFRSKIGGFQKFGEPLSIPGGHALEHSTSVQMVMKNKEHYGKDATDVDTVDFNEHSYTIQKNKLNNGPRTGEFKMVRTDMPGLNLRVGDIDENRTLITYAKKFGLWGGAGKSQKLILPDREIKFANQDQAYAILNEDDDLTWELRCHLIQQQAINQGMPREFIETIK